jgi:hypothetical protein
VIKFFHCFLGIVMVEWFPLGPRFNHIVGFDSVTHQCGQLVKLTVDTVTFAVGVGPLLGSRQRYRFLTSMALAHSVLLTGSVELPLSEPYNNSRKKQVTFFGTFVPNLS